MHTDISASVSTYEDDEISLLDLLVTITDNLKLLILGPMAAGLIALGVGYAVAPTFESEALIKVPNPVSTTTTTTTANKSLSAEALAATLQSAVALDPVVLANGGPNTAQGQTLTDARKALQSRISVSIGKKDGLLTLKAQGESPQQAQQLAQQLIAQAQRVSKPHGDDLKRLQDQLDNQKLQLEAAQQALREYTQSKAANNTSAPLLLTLVQSASQRMLELEDHMRGLTDSDIVQSPTLPDRAIKPNKSLIAVVAALATGFALLLFVFVRQAMRNAAADPTHASKLAHIKRSLGFKA